MAVAAMAAMISGCSAKSTAAAQETAETVTADSIATVYYIKDITPDNLVKIYKALVREAKGNNVAVKISTGESNKTNHLRPELIEPLMKAVNGTIVECNTAYAGNRNSTEAHLKAAEEHGYTKIAKVDIMDADGDSVLPINGEYLQIDHDIVGKHFFDYDFLIVLSHFKGHQMGGFGGALKNVAIGIASSAGKTWIHTAGKTANIDSIWGNIAEQDHFLEAMADANKAVINHMGNKILYINVANNLSIDCDCNGNPAAPEMADLGILASLDPVALDKASVDMVFNSNDPGKQHLIERINQMHGTHTIDAAEKLGLGTQKYKIITLE